MHSCPKCGYKEEELNERPELEDEDDREVSMKSDVLKELMDLMGGSLGEKLKTKKPKPLPPAIEDEEEDEEEQF